MYQRLLDLPLDQSVLLFGPRGSGKSTLLRESFAQEHCLWYDLLDPVEESRLSAEPQLLLKETHGARKSTTHVIVDEVQKVPKLLDVVHSLIEDPATRHLRFMLTGSSARKLKRGGANLLAGRALVFSLHPFSALELGADFNLFETLAYGALPGVVNAKGSQSKKRFLRSYGLTYLKEEVQVEQLVRQLDPFRKFLQVCAQCSGKIINAAAIARDVGVDEKTVKNYYSILEDTLLGFHLEAYHSSVRKRLSLKPKFYLFDTGVQRTLMGHLNLPLAESTSAFGELFKSFVVNECLRLSQYAENDYRFFYLRTKEGLEIDLVVERPGLPLLLIEIKSGTQVGEAHLKSLRTLGSDFPGAECVCLARVLRAQETAGVKILPWLDGLKHYFALETGSE